ncbi:MAG: periplasmic heavy metal sensor [Gemmatimonadetes bacterium]|nr:periplasmic heavy metal sensor [Gemmatimonadota bacterium]NIU29885.1 periplasmic heavy metal sensor [Gemmatimonadota bacterium]NIV60292.1 periplasmic heavy metal sensor [Gemmatimonadota bacterium]NIW62955.1 periplasmic heavy metal sensor [Gemmatimonadota bacterium]NIX38334.1 periplasmic heavy metal sensor [Gemmatimonadota bacterium]
MLTIATGLLLAATGLTAQMPGMHRPPSDTVPGMMGPGMMMGGMMGQGMMGAGMTRMMGMGMMATGGPGPTMLLRMRDALELTDDQVSRLEAIREDHSGDHRAAMGSAISAHRRAAEALHGASPDFQAYEDALGEAADHMVRAHVTMARASVQAREVLTAEQRERLHSGMRMMQEMMGEPGMGPGMMRHHPME